MNCKTCGEEIRRVYSVASSGEDDYLAECGCGMDAGEILGILIVLGFFAGVIALFWWFTN